MLTRFEARGFRNLSSLELDLSPGGHLFLGDNGAGKTSLIEAIYLLATTRSFRSPRVGECVQHGESSFFLRGETQDRSQLEVAWVDGDRIRKARGEHGSLADHLAVLPVVSWVSSDIDVLVGPPEARRRFLDRGVIGRRPSAISVISRYRRALQEKRKLIQRSEIPPEELMEQLIPWNLILASAASELAQLRNAQVSELEEQLREVVEICQLDLPPISLRYKPSPKEALDGEEAIFAKMEFIARREVAAQQPIIGIHRDELEIRWQGHPIRRVASAGERKALGLALIAAHGRVLEKVCRPIYLLDDVDTELDAGRLASLWNLFRRAPQVMVTSNRPAVWRDLAVERRFRCASGTVRENE